MWRIVKAEFNYVWYLILIVVTLMVTGFHLYFRVNDHARFENILLPLSVSIILQVLIIRSIEKRDRFIVLLPVDTGVLARARVLLFFIPALALHLLYFLAYFILRDGGVRWQHDLFDVMMFFGLVLIGGSVYFIQHDIIQSRLKKRLSPELDVSIIILLITVIFLGIPLLLAPIWGLSGNILRVTCFIAGWVSLCLAQNAFQHRRSYLE